MNYDSNKTAVLLMFVGAAQVILAAIVSESVYSGVNVVQKEMTALGTFSSAGNYAAIFDVSVLLLGLTVIAGAYFIQRIFRNKLFTALLSVSGAGVVAMALVANFSLQLHSIFAMVTFVALAVSAFMSYKFEKSPLSYVSVVLGVVMLSALVLFVLGQVNSGFYLGISIGGMERFIIYPALLWLLGFGAYLIGDSSETVPANKV